MSSDAGPPAVPPAPVRVGAAGPAGSAGSGGASVPGLLFIVSAPSGTGKTTLVERLVTALPGLRMSCSYTSRPARQGEQDGVDYNFIDRLRFESMVAAGAFLEWAEVFGNYYGTCANDTDAILARGEDVVLVIDVQGARQVRDRGVHAIGVFVLPPSAGVLEQRLRGRSKDSDEQIRRRLDTASREVGEFVHYQYLVVNDALDTAVDRLGAIVLAERSRVARMRHDAAAIIASFPDEERQRDGIAEQESHGTSAQGKQV